MGAIIGPIRLLGDAEEQGNGIMDKQSSPFLAHLDAAAKDTDALLDRLLSAHPVAGELNRPPRID